MNLFRKVPWLHGVLPVFVSQIAVFPVLSVLFACVAFLCGGSCAAWQWWLAVACVMAFPAFSREREKAWFADVLFPLFLAILYVWFSFCSDDTLASDYTEYHLPAIRLLIEGWNPVRDADMGVILKSLNLEPWDMRYLHVQFCERAVWIFNAVAFKFFRQPYATSIMLNPFLEVFLLYTCLRFARSFGWHWAYGVCLFLSTVFLSAIGWPIDDAVIFASGILLMSMTVSLREGRFCWLGLMASSFWLMNAKMPSLLFCFVFWMLFSLACLWRARGAHWRVVRKLAVAGAVLIAAWIVSSWSPFVTSFQRYGHPFYPMMTVDEERYPVVDITGSLKQRNADGDMLGYWGNFVNAYVSPKLVRNYYNHKLNRTDFAPRCWEWTNGAGPDADSALTVWQRTVLQLTLLVLVCLPGMRFLALLFVVDLFCIPPQYHGYLRYLPWAYFMTALSGVALAQKLLHGHRHLEWIAASFLLLVLAKTVSQTLLGVIAYVGEIEDPSKKCEAPVYASSYLDCGYSWLESRRETIKVDLERNKVSVSGTAHPGIRSRNNNKLLLKELGFENYGDVRRFSNEFPRANLVEYHGGYFRQSEVPKVNMTAMGLPDRVRYVLANKLGPFIRLGFSMLRR